MQNEIVSIIFTVIFYSLYNHLSMFAVVHKKMNMWYMWITNFIFCGNETVNSALTYF